MFNLTSHVANKPIMDGPFIRHLRTDPIFQELNEKRQAEADTFAAVQAAIIKHSEAVKERKAAEAKAELMASMEDL